jgi:hypothetical protein
MQTMIEKEKRTEAILSTLSRLDYLSTSQLQKLHRLGKSRNAQRILREMSDYLSSFRDNENIYYLNREGRERIGCQKVRKKTLQARHYLMRNELYIALNRPMTWQNEMKLSVSGATIICDALYKNGSQYVFIEVDHLQKMSQNKVKIDKYRKIIDSQKTKPQLVWVTTTEHRRKRLQTLCEDLSARVFTIEDLK